MQWIMFWILNLIVGMFLTWEQQRKTEFHPDKWNLRRDFKCKDVVLTTFTILWISPTQCFRNARNEMQYKVNYATEIINRHSSYPSLHALMIVWRTKKCLNLNREKGWMHTTKHLEEIFPTTNYNSMIDLLVQSNWNN